MTRYFMKNTFLFSKSLYIFLLCSALLSLVACSMPKVRKVSDAELSSAMSSLDTSSAAALEQRLAAIRRTGDILSKTTIYHPYIKVANIYVSSSLHADGIYQHGSVVSVPLLLNARKNSADHLELSQGFKTELEKAHDDAPSTLEATAHTEASVNKGTTKATASKVATTSANTPKADTALK